MSLADLVKNAGAVSDPDATLVEAHTATSLADIIQRAKDSGLIKPGFEYGSPVVA
jgi:hypothetical protein